MGLKIANTEDLENVTRLGVQFASGTILNNYFSEERVRLIVETLISQPLHQSVVFVFDTIGFLAASRKDNLAEEIAWYVTPDGRGQGIGKQLLDAFEYWAFMNQCKLIKMTSLDPETGKYFEKNGYVLGEYNYFKEIN